MSESPIAFEDRDFSPAQTGELMGICRVQVHRLIASGKLKSHKIGRARRINGRTIKEFRDSGGDS